MDKFGYPFSIKYQQHISFIQSIDNVADETSVIIVARRLIHLSLVAS